MIGVHDLGGVRGHGPVVAEADEPVFHEPWEAHMFAANFLGGRWTAPEFRAGIERMPPAVYLATSYYEHWLIQMESHFVESGLLTRAEIDRRAAGPRPAPALPPGATPLPAEQVLPAALKGGRNRAELATAPRFTRGDRVVLSRDNPPTHSRVPAYARGCTGTVVALHGGFDFADAQAQGIHDAAQHLYTVRCEATELWGRDAGGRDAVYLDMYESYLTAAP